MKKRLVVLFEGEKYRKKKSKQEETYVCRHCVLYNQCIGLRDEGNCLAHVCANLIGIRHYFARNSKECGLKK